MANTLTFSHRVHLVSYSSLLLPSYSLHGRSNFISFCCHHFPSSSLDIYHVISILNPSILFFATQDEHKQRLIKDGDLFLIVKKMYSNMAGSLTSDIKDSLFELLAGTYRYTRNLSDAPTEEELCKTILDLAKPIITEFFRYMHEVDANKVYATLAGRPSGLDGERESKEKGEDKEGESEVRLETEIEKIEKGSENSSEQPPKFSSTGRVMSETMRISECKIAREDEGTEEVSEPTTSDWSL